MLPDTNPPWQLQCPPCVLQSARAVSIHTRTMPGHINACTATQVWLLGMWILGWANRNLHRAWITYCKRNYCNYVLYTLYRLYIDI